MMRSRIWSRKEWIAALGCLAITGAANGVVPQDTYGSISERNVFGLVAPKPAETPTVSVPLPKIIPTGIITFIAKRALFKVLWTAQPNQPAREESFILSEGERAGSIEVVQIDEKAGAVKFNNNGTLMLLSLEKDGLKPVPATAQAPNPLSASPFQTPQTPQTPSSAKPLTAAEQTVLMEVERLRNAEAIKSGRLPPLPQTVLTPR